MLPYICIPLMQQKIVSQSEALDIAMKFEASPIREIGAKMMQIHSQVSNLTLQLHDINKGKEL